MSNLYQNNTRENGTDQAVVSFYAQKITQTQHEVGKVVVGQQNMINRLLIGLFTGGHILLEGVPGLAKTLTINTLSQAIDCSFKRIQFTPDLLPADLNGTMIYNQKESNFVVKKGPIFANFILADEINRAPAKVQSALLEAMQEKQVTIGETTYKLEKPFLVMATQNPVDQEGTYPLPEAQVDRFMMKVLVEYPSKQEELDIIRRMSSDQGSQTINPILSKDDIKKIAQLVDQIYIAPSLEQYIVELIFATRNPLAYQLKDIAPLVRFGASPRAGINLHRAAKALAFMDGRDFVLPQDIKTAAIDVLNHRILLSYEAQADGINTFHILEKIFDKVEIPTL